MRLLRNLFALIGVASLIAVGVVILAFEPYVNKARSLDEVALGVYVDMARTILETGDPMEAMVHQRRAVAGRSVAEIEQHLEDVAAELGLHSLGTLRIGQEVLAGTGHDFPLLNIYLFCDPVLAADLMGLNPSMAAFLPCRVILYQDQRDGLWVMTPNLDLVIHGGRPLPLALQERAFGLQETLREMVDRAAGIGI